MGFANAESRVVVDYGEDPRNPATGLVRDVLARINGFVSPAFGAFDGDPTTTRGGAVDYPVQNFHGAVAPTTSGAVYGGTPEISDALVSGPAGDPARRIFAARLRRRLA